MIRKVMTTEEVASLLHVKKATVWGYVRDKRLIAKKIGREYFIYPDAFESFLTRWRPDLLDEWWK